MIDIPHCSLCPNPNPCISNINNISALILLTDLEHYAEHWMKEWFDRYKVWREEKRRRSEPTLGPEAVNFRHADELSEDEDSHDGGEADEGQATAYQEIPPGPVEPSYPPRGRVRFRQSNTEDWSREWILWDHSECSLESDMVERYYIVLYYTVP